MVTKFNLNLILENIWPQTNSIEQKRGKKKKKVGVGCKQKNFPMDKLPKLPLCEILNASVGRGNTQLRRQREGRTPTSIVLEIRGNP